MDNYSVPFKGYWKFILDNNPSSFDLLEFDDNGVLYSLKLNWKRRDKDCKWEQTGNELKISFNNGYMVWRCTFANDLIVGQAENKNGVTYPVKGIRDVNLASVFLNDLWRFTINDHAENYIVDFVSYDECRIYSEDLKLIEGNHSWLLITQEISVCIDACSIILFGTLHDNVVQGKVTLNGVSHSFTGQKYIPVTEKALHINEVKKLSSTKFIWFTRATKIELDAKLGKNELYHIPGRPPRKIRDRLVYHVDQRCAYALKDYEIAGEIIAFNSGVVFGEYHGLLELCKCCGRGYFNPCDRCGGSGYLPQYDHVAGGVCFKCGGAGHFALGNN